MQNQPFGRFAGLGGSRLGGGHVDRTWSARSVNLEIHCFDRPGEEQEKNKQKQILENVENNVRQTLSPIAPKFQDGAAYCDPVAG